MSTSLFALLSCCLLSLFASEPATQPAKLAGESHQIQNVAQEDLLRPRDASSRDGAPIVLYPHQDWKCMTWKLEPAGDDVRLMNYFTHKTFYPDAQTEGSAVSQHSAAKEPTDVERWRFVPVDGRNYKLEHAATGLVLTVSDDGKITIQKWNNSAAQQWKLLAKPDHFTG